MHLCHNNAIDVATLIDYNYVVRFYIGKRMRVLVADEDVMKQILTKDFESFPDRPVGLVTL